MLAKILIPMIVFVAQHKYIESIGFNGIPGQFCTQTKPSLCCLGRNDSCFWPVLGSRCYCDVFCLTNPSQDCCPDYQAACFEVFPELTPEPEREEPSENYCTDSQGLRYKQGEKYKENCNECTCGATCETNICTIDLAILALVNGNLSSSWQASNYSIFWGQTLKTSNSIKLGTLKPAEFVMNMNPLVFVNNLALPKNFDSRQKWPGMIHKSQDQQNCAASWAFVAAKVASDRLAIKTRNVSNFDLSPQELLSCLLNFGHNCKGGHIDQAWQYIRWHGLPNASKYLYKSGRQGESFECKEKLHKNEKHYKLSPPHRISFKARDIQIEIFKSGPVHALMHIYRDFYMYKSGVYQSLFENNSAWSCGYHSVRIFGWGTDLSTGVPIDFWLCDNSWGELWGNQGTFKILRDQNHCEIESFIVSAY